MTLQSGPEAIPTFCLWAVLFHFWSFNLLKLLKEKSLESISTTEICQEALTSRNTFYNYYSDKYALVQDCFADLEADVAKRFESYQSENNAGGSLTLTFQNLVDALMDAEGSYDGTRILSSFDPGSMYFRFMMQGLAKLEAKYELRNNSMLTSGYDYKQLNAFVVLGVYGFIHGNPTLSKEEIRTRTKRLAADLAESRIFAKH